VGIRFGRYELLRPLGRGGMAEVFLARFVGPEGFEKRLVIKRILPALGGDRRFLRLFFDEARTQVSLSHGNLVPVFDFGRVGNAYFIAMDYVRGCDLGTLLSAGHKRGEKLPPRLVAHVGVELCRGLSYVHRRGFVHRDVSPRNVLLSTDGEVKLSDFGVALTAASDAAPGLRGTLGYMAPEQARGERPDARADLFALGMVLGEALIGRRLRQSADDAEALAAARAGDSVTLEGPLATVIARATSAAPEARYADAEAMMVALEEAVAALGRVGAAAARELAERVVAWVPTTAAGDDQASGEAATAAPETEPTVGEETYFRGRNSASFVDDVLPPAPRRWRAWMTAAAGAAAIAAMGALFVVRARSPGREHAPVDRAPTTVVPAPSEPAMALTPPATPTQPTAAKTKTSEGKRATAKKVVETGTVLVQCTPWCVPSVDDQVRGEDGRNHRLTVPAGTHRVSVRRLDDRQERRVDVRAGASQTVAFTFD
jgi:hypothetical protein